MPADSPPEPGRVVLVAGPSGSGKSRLVDHLGHRHGMATVQLDDFYRSADATGLPHANGRIDWDDPRSWDGDAAVRALLELCRTGAATVPDYDIPTSRPVGTRQVRLGDGPLVLAEGIFAAEIIAPLRDIGLLAEAVALRHGPWVTFARRLARDLRQGRKAPLTLVRRGWALRRAEPAIRARQTRLGAAECSPTQAKRRIEALLRHPAPSPLSASNP